MRTFNFKVGDRVSAYGYSSHAVDLHGEPATIISFDEKFPEFARIVPATNWAFTANLDYDYEGHVRQLVKVVKKKPRKVVYMVEFANGEELGRLFESNQNVAESLKEKYPGSILMRLEEPKKK